MALTPREKLLRKKWSNRTHTADDTRHHTGRAHLAHLDGVFGTVEPDAPDTLRCSYCHNIVDGSEATFGKSPSIIRTQKLHVDETTGEIEVEDLKLHRQTRVIACPSCSLQIKPAISRDICPNCEGTKKVVREGKEFNCLRCAKADKQGRLKSTGRVDGSIRTNTYFVSREEM